MKNSEVEVGVVYRAKVSGKMTDVRVDEINTSPARVVAGRYGSFKIRKRFVISATNISTGRKVSFRSGAKLSRKPDMGHLMTSLAKE